MRLLSIAIGLIYCYIKYKFKVVFMPSYLYEYEFNEDDIRQDMYDEIIKTYTDSVFIITAIEGMLITMFLTQYFISPSISIEISQSGGYMF